MELTVPLSVRQMGMGGVSTGGADVLRAWCNPSLLGRQENQWEVAAGGASVFGQERSVILGGGWAPLPAWSLGFFGLSNGVSANELDESGKETGKSLSQGLTAAGLGVAWRPNWLSVGVAGKFVSETVGGFAASGALVDAGVEARRWGFSIAAAIRNLGSDLAFPSAVTVKLPNEIRGGLAYLYEPLRISAGIEYARVTGLNGMLGIGVEWWPVKMLAVRTGYMGEAGAKSITAGLTGVYRGIAVDYAIATHDIGLSNRVSWPRGGTPASAGPSPP
jgi:hypothetical protein